MSVENDFDYFDNMVYERCNSHLEKMSLEHPEYREIVLHRIELSKELQPILSGEDGRLTAEECEKISQYIQSYDNLVAAKLCYKRGFMDCTSFAKFFDK